MHATEQTVADAGLTLPVQPMGAEVPMVLIPRRPFRSEAAMQAGWLQKARSKSKRRAQAKVARKSRQVNRARAR